MISGYAKMRGLASPLIFYRETSKPPCCVPDSRAANEKPTRQMYTLFELDEHYPGTRLYEVTDTADPDFPEKHMAVSFRYRLLDEFLKEWQLRKKQLREGEITKEEYLEWKLNWPQTADGCGRYEPKKKWRKE